MRARLAQGYAGATLRVTPVRMFGEGDLVALEAEGYAELPNGHVYQNRYAFVIEVGAGGIAQVQMPTRSTSSTPPGASSDRLNDEGRSMARLTITGLAGLDEYLGKESASSE